MKAILIALLAFGLIAATATYRPTLADMRASALRIRTVDGICSGTAIAPHKLLTARHCFNDRLVSVNDVPMQALKFDHEGDDTVVVTVSGTFKQWARRGPKPVQGERVRFIGNPMGEPGVYREAIVSRVRPGQIILQGMVCAGDSGAGLYSDRGEVVGIVDAMTDRACKFGIGI